MKIYLTKRFVFKNLQYRIFALLVLIISVLGVNYWQSFDNSIYGSLLVRLQPEPEPIFQNRDLSKYDFGGEVAGCFNYSSKECESEVEQARKFILNHWKNKKRGYVILLYSGTHGRVRHVFIEPNKNGQWQVTLNNEVADFDRDFNKNISQIYATKVKRKFVNKKLYPLNNNDSMLVFLDSDGEEIYLF